MHIDFDEDEFADSPRPTPKRPTNPRRYTYAQLRQFPTLCSAPLAVRHARWSGKEWIKARCKISTPDRRVWLTDNYRVVVELKVPGPKTGWDSWRVTEEYLADDAPRESVKGKEQLDLEPLIIPRSVSEEAKKILQRMISTHPKRRARKKL